MDGPAQLEIRAVLEHLVTAVTLASVDIPVILVTVAYRDTPVSADGLVILGSVDILESQVILEVEFQDTADILDQEFQATQVIAELLELAHQATVGILEFQATAESADFQDQAVDSLDIRATVEVRGTRAIAEFQVILDTPVVEYLATADILELEPAVTAE